MHFRKSVIILGLCLCCANHASALNLIANGDFESAGPAGGIPGWVTGANPSTYNPTTHTAVQWDASTGTIAAAAGNYQGDYANAWLNQSVYIPNDALGTTLTFYYAWFCAVDPWGSTLYFTAHLGGIELAREQGNGGNPQPTPTPGWKRVDKYIDLENYAGQPLDLRFWAYDTDGPSANFVHIDAVSMDVITATKTTTPTLTCTPTITLTSTISPTSTMTPTITKTITVTPSVTPTLTLTPWSVALGDVVAYPNPAKGNQISFLYSLDISADVYVDIFNTVGYKIAHLEDYHRDALINQRLTWDISGIAPGLYLYQVTFKKDNRQFIKTKIKKLVITK